MWKQDLFSLELRFKSFVYSIRVKQGLWKYFGKGNVIQIQNYFEGLVGHLPLLASWDVKGELIVQENKFTLLGTKTKSLPARTVRSPPMPPDVSKKCCQNTSVVFQICGYFCFFVRRASHQSTVSSLTPHGHGTAWCQQGHSSGMLYWPHGLSLALIGQRKWLS